VTKPFSLSKIGRSGRSQLSYFESETDSCETRRWLGPPPLTSKCRYGPGKGRELSQADRNFKRSFPQLQLASLSW